jgi:hypothetical protein
MLKRKWLAEITAVVYFGIVSSQNVPGDAEESRESSR